MQKKIDWYHGALGKHVCNKTPIEHKHVIQNPGKFMADN